jgi:2-methylaconitate cis-trans-isomerase PrpF
MNVKDFLIGDTGDMEGAIEQARVVASQTFETLIDAGIPLIVINVAADMLQQGTEQQLAAIAEEMKEAMLAEEEA